ncbi:hypothetical protein [Microseira sp. BLCC-F43]|jgi:hypothetical protein|uniref:hypothetical protein n=1 Tax=Microseira sp. BLCC-F43 TaxID=3153602 RepID=UPI0035B78029
MSKTPNQKGKDDIDYSQNLEKEKIYSTRSRYILIIVLAVLITILFPFVFDLYANNKSNDVSAPVGLVEVQILVADENGQPLNNA